MSAQVPALLGVASIRRAVGQSSSALELYERALEIQERELGEEEVTVLQTRCEVASVLCNLAAVERAAGRDGEAYSLLAQALALRERAHGPQHPLVAQTLSHMAAACRALGEYDEAAELCERVQAAKAAMYGEEAEVAVRAGERVEAARKEAFAKQGLRPAAQRQK